MSNREQISIENTRSFLSRDDLNLINFLLKPKLFDRVDGHDSTWPDVVIFITVRCSIKIF